MSTAQNPLTGKMSGSMGNFITTVHKGKNIIKSKAFNPRDANSEAQQAQRSSFKLVVDEYNGLGGMVDIGFPECDDRTMPYNIFVRENLKAIDKTGDAPTIDYSKMKVAFGSLPLPVVSGVQITATGITVSYINKLRIPKVKSTDQVCLLVKMEDGELFFEEKSRGELPSDTISFTRDHLSVEQVVFAYLFVLSEDGTKASNSLFLSLQ